jgi:cbb3-type cytochrome oxidase subunit 3
MFDELLITACKLTSLLIFFPIFVGAVVYAYWGPNKAKMEAYGRIPFDHEDHGHG